MKKIKVLFCGYVNFPNAQNINCSALARFFNHHKFEKHSFYLSGRPLDREHDFNNVHLHRIFSKRFLFILSYAWHLITKKYDIYYMPKCQPFDIIFAKLFGRKKCIIVSLESIKKINKSFFKNYGIKFFSISRFIQDYARKSLGIDTKVIYLGIDKVSSKRKRRTNLRRVYFVGNIKPNKRPMLFLECAKRFPDLDFIMIGDGEQLDEVKEYIFKLNIKNVQLVGRIPNNDVINLLKEADLLLLTSKYEGLPKVVLEAAACGVPSVYINTNYFVDYIINDYNGYGVTDLSEAINIIQDLIENPDKLDELSKNAYKTAFDFTWKQLIPNYEDFFIAQLIIHATTNSLRP